MMITTKDMNKYFTIDPKDNRILIETENHESPLVIYDYEYNGDSDPCCAKELDFSYKKFDDNVKSYCKEAFLDVYNRDEVSIEDAIGLIVRNRGLVLYNRKEGTWYQITAIGVILISTKLQENRHKTLEFEHTTVVVDNNENEIVDLKKHPEKATSNTTNVITWTQDELYPKRDNTTKTKLDDEKPVQTNSTEYLKAGREGEPFFYEGSVVDKTGAAFRIDYSDITMEGEYDLIIDINNLRTVSPGFRREVIKMINDGTTLRAASSFITVEKGKAHFSKDDGVWLVDKPLIIKLIN